MEEKITFHDQVNWDEIAYNRISKEDFNALKARFPKAYGTLLGSQDALQFYMFKPLYWGEYRHIKEKALTKEAMHEFILNSCLLWPALDVVGVNSLESGIIITLVYQILATSYFLSDPSKALEMIIEV